MEPDHFEVEDDEGNVVMVFAIADEIPVPSHSNPDATIPGLVSLFTEDEQPVRVVDGFYIIGGKRFKRPA